MRLIELDNGDWVRIVGVDFGAASARSLLARVASADPGGYIELRLGSPDGKRLGTCKVENTGGWQEWTDASCVVADATGVQDLYLKFTGGEKPLLNLDYWKFE